MDARIPRQQTTPARTRRARFAVTLVGAVALIGAACGGGGATGSSSGSTAAFVSQPALDLQGCTYEVSSTIPAGEPQGVQPPFSAFTPDAAAGRAVQQIKDHGGTAMVDSVTVPSGIDLFAGPDAGQPAVGTVPSGDNVLAAEPVVYTDHSGGTWLAFFLACGGEHLYWISLDQAKHRDPAFVSDTTSLIQQLRQAQPYTQSQTASLLPVTVDTHHHLVFADPSVHFVVGRGELYTA